MIQGIELLTGSVLPPKTFGNRAGHKLFGPTDCIFHSEAGSETSGDGGRKCAAGSMCGNAVNERLLKIDDVILPKEQIDRVFAAEMPAFQQHRYAVTFLQVLARFTHTRKIGDGTPEKLARFEEVRRDQSR